MLPVPLLQMVECERFLIANTSISCPVSYNLKLKLVSYEIY
jgi:hypothetical protein